MRQIWSRRLLLTVGASLGFPALGSGSPLATFGAALVGVYEGTVTFPDRSTMASLFVFHADGTLTETNSRITTPGVGIWWTTGHNAQGMATFTYTFREFLLQSGVYLGTVHVSQHAVLAPSGKTLTASGSGTLYDPQGNAVQTQQTTMVVRRIEREDA